MDETIRLAHGGGGTLSHRLHEFIIERLGGQNASALADAALLDIACDANAGDSRCARVAFTTDSYIVSPRRFPGGDIGRLAVCGTVNDLAVMGATPVALSLGLIIEEGLSASELGEYLDSAKLVADEASVKIVTGDSKVVERGGADGLFVNTSGIGIVRADRDIAPTYAAPGQKILINGTLGDHSIAVIAAREGLSFAGQIESDCAPLAGLIRDAMIAARGRVRVMRDPTRGGIASALNEIARASAVNITIYEDALPVSPKVSAACALLGYDILHLANEGKVLFFIDDTEGANDAGGADCGKNGDCAGGAVSRALAAMHAHPFGKNAAIIGEVTARAEKGRARVVMKTSIGGTRIIDVLSGELLPRIC